MPTIEEQFIKDFNRKQTSLTAINQMIRQGAEFEIPSFNSPYLVKSNLRNEGLGCSSNISLNDGNGWNNDTHVDGGSALINDIVYEGCETSTAPLNSTTYKGIKAEFGRLFEIYLRASGGLRHSYYSSTHVHTAIGYANFSGIENVTVVENLPVKEMYRNMGMFFTKFYPVLKWLTMTCKKGARGADGNGYDCLDGDSLYSWSNRVVQNRHESDLASGHTNSTDSYLRNMGRESIFRVIRSDIFHFENRMMDCNFSETHMAAWLMLNRAVALWSLDMARNGFYFSPSQNEIDQSCQVSDKHRSGWKYVPKPWIVENYTLMKSYLYKYFKLTNSLDALDIFDKLIDCPIPQFLDENDLNKEYDMTKMESYFAVRVREKDDVLRNKYLEVIKSMVVPMAGNLNDFHLNISAFLGIQQKQAVSLYQMLKRENTDLEFLAGRLVYMGE